MQILVAKPIITLLLSFRCCNLSAAAGKPPSELTEISQDVKHLTQNVYNE